MSEVRGPIRYDDDDALKHIYEQKKINGELQFKVGGAIMLLKDLDDLCKRPSVKGNLAYERKIVKGNKYHGNILLKKVATKVNRYMIASTLGLYVNRIENSPRMDK